MTTEDIYLAYLRTAIFEVPLQIDSQNAIDWPALVRLAERQGTAPLIYNQILKYPAYQQDLSSSQKTYMKQICMSNMLEQERMFIILKKTWQALLADNVYPILLKGFSLARLYPQSYLRTWGDLDVYVGPAQYHHAADVLRKTYPEASHHEQEWEELKHYNFTFDNSLIEMHRSTMAFFSKRDEKIYYALEKDGMQAQCLKTIDIDGIMVSVPETKFNVLFTFMHAWEHFFESGAGMKHLCDLALLLRSVAIEGVSKDELEKYLLVHLRQLKLLQPWRIMGYVVVKTLQLSSCGYPLYKDNALIRNYGERLYKRIMAEGLCRPHDFGDSKDRYEARDKAMRMSIIARKWITLKSKIAEATPMWHYAPYYTLHRLAASIGKGVRRTIKGEGMVLY